MIKARRNKTTACCRTAHISCQWACSSCVVGQECDLAQHHQHAMLWLPLRAQATALLRGHFPPRLVVGVIALVPRLMYIYTVYCLCIYHCFPTLSSPLQCCFCAMYRQKKVKATTAIVPLQPRRKKMASRKSESLVLVVVRQQCCRRRHLLGK